MIKKNLPYIFIFDIDNCIIGDVSYVLYENDILELIRKECEKKKIIIKMSKNDKFQKRFKSRFIETIF